MINSAYLWVQTFSSIIQAVMTIGVMVVTLLYVIFTKKMLDQNFSTFIVITGITVNAHGITIHTENHGSSIALNVEAVILLNKGKEHQRIRLEGKSMIAPGEKPVFKCNETPADKGSDITVQIRYRSQTRSARTEEWRRRDGEEIRYFGKV